MSSDIIFNGPISINNMERSSLQFGLVNLNNGWSSHAKENTNIQIQSDHNILTNNLSILFDQDGIDTYIDDRDIHYLLDNSENIGDPQIDVHSMLLNSIQENSIVSIGKTNVSGVDGHNKDNNAMGAVRGHFNQIKHNIGINEDQDMVDAPINDQDIKVNRSVRG